MLTAVVTYHHHHPPSVNGELSERLLFCFFPKIHHGKQSVTLQSANQPCLGRILLLTLNIPFVFTDPPSRLTDFVPVELSGNDSTQIRPESTQCGPSFSLLT